MLLRAQAGYSDRPRLHSWLSRQATLKVLGPRWKAGGEQEGDKRCAAPEGEGVPVLEVVGEVPVLPPTRRGENKEIQESPSTVSRPRLNRVSTVSRPCHNHVSTASQPRLNHVRPSRSRQVLGGRCVSPLTTPWGLVVAPSFCFCPYPCPSKQFIGSPLQL